MTTRWLLLFLLVASDVFAAAGVTVWTQDDFVKVLPSDAAGTNSGLSMEAPRLSYGSGQLVAQCTGGGPCTTLDLALPHLIHSGLAYTISATTNATPVAVTTATPHGLSSGGNVQITGTGIGALDGNVYDITVTGASSFTLTGTSAPGSTAATGTVKPAIDKKHLVAYREDPMQMWYPVPYNTTVGEQPYYLVAGYVGGSKKDPYLGQVRTVFPVTVNTFSPVYRKFTIRQNYGHIQNANLPVNLFTNGTLFRGLTSWTLSATGTGSTPSWPSSPGVTLAAGGAGTSKVEQCIRTWAGMDYLASAVWHSGTFKIQVGTASGLTDLVAATTFTADGYVRWAGTTGTACIQYVSTSGTSLVNELTVTRLPSPFWFHRGTVNPVGNGWTDKSSVGTVTWASGAGLTFANAGAAIEAQFTLQAHTTYGVIYSGGDCTTNMNFTVGTTTGGTDVKTSTALHTYSGSAVTFASGTSAGTGYFRLTKPAAGSCTLGHIYLTTGLSAGRITLTSSNYTGVSNTTYQFFVSRSGSSATATVGQFYWSADAGATWTGPVSMTGAAQSLSNGLSATFTGAFSFGEEQWAYAGPTRNQAIWLDVYADDVAVAGPYTGTAVVTTAAPSTSTNVTLTMTVLPLTQPADSNHWHTYYAMDETSLPFTHDVVAETTKDWHKLWAKGCLRNHLTCGSNLGRYLSWTYNAVTGAISGSGGFATANELGKLFMDGVNEYGTLGWYSVPKGAKWSTLLLIRCPNQGGGTNPPTCDTLPSYSGVNYTKLLNTYTDATYGLTAKWLACTTVGCDASNNHNDWSADSRLFMYGIDEPGGYCPPSGTSAVTSGGVLSDCGRTFTAMRTWMDAILPNATFGTTMDLIPASAGDGPAFRAAMDLWFAVEEYSNKGYNRTNENFKVNGYSNSAQRDDYLNSDLRATKVAWYTACNAHGCGPNTTMGLEMTDAYGNPSPGFMDGTSKLAAADDAMLNWRILGWQGWDWGRPQPNLSTVGGSAAYWGELYYTITDQTQCAWQTNYTGTCQDSAFDRVREEENMHMWLTPGEGQFLVPARHTRADIGGTNDYVIETLPLKGIRQRVTDTYFLKLAYDSSVDGGAQLNTLVKSLIESSVRYTKDVAGFRRMVSTLHNLATQAASKNRERASAYPRSITGAYAKP